MQTEKKQRMTKQRKLILNVLKGLKTHPTADELYEEVRKAMPGISLGTVYRNLDLLAKNGQILKLESAGSQKRFDADMTPHCHVRCMSCGAVGDIKERLPRPSIEGLSAKGFVLIEGCIEFYGLCQWCEAMKESA